VISRAWLIAMVIALSACSLSGSAYPGQITTTFDGNKKLVLVADYGANAAAIGILAWADVDDGTAGILEVTGPLHMRCEGLFRPHDPKYQDPDNLPHLDVGDGGSGANFHAPRGHYTAVVTLPSKKASIQKSFDAGYSSSNAITGTYDLPLSCVPIADSGQQQSTLLSEHVLAVQIWVTRMAASPTRAQLLPLASEAARAVESGDRATALHAMAQITDIVRPLASQNPYYNILRDALASIALLNQPAPAG
jgi:hypothetical protein